LILLNSFEPLCILLTSSALLTEMDCANLFGPEQEWAALSKGTEMVWLNKKGAAGVPGHKCKELPE